MECLLLLSSALAVLQVLLGWDSSGSSHDAVGDAIKSIRLFNLYTALQADPAAWQKAQVRGLATPVADLIMKGCMPLPQHKGNNKNMPKGSHKQGKPVCPLDVLH